MSSNVTTETTTADTSASDTLDDAVAREEHQRHKEPTDRQYIYIAIFLGVVTALEVAAVEVGWDGPILIVTLVALMAIKFAFVVLFFMHLRFDSRLFSMVFYIGLFLAIALYLVMLATFHFFSG
jgi:cytochrome c oxidase subunit IV